MGLLSFLRQVCHYSTDTDLRLWFAIGTIFPLCSCRFCTWVVMVGVTKVLPISVVALQRILPTTRQQAGLEHAHLPTD